MALQIRRGTNQERLGITPVEGEIVFVTDSTYSTITVTSIDATTNILTTTAAHSLTTGFGVTFNDATSNGLVKDTTYFALVLSDTTFKLYTTRALAIAGHASTGLVDITGTTTDLEFDSAPRSLAYVPIRSNVSPLWVGDGLTVGGVPGGATTLDELFDVEIGTYGVALADGYALADNQLLNYNATTSKWENRSNVIVPGTLTVQSTTDSSSKDTGAVIVEGGIGVEKALYVGTNLRVLGSTNSTTKDTGALLVTDGGLGVELAIVAGTNITAGGDVAVNGGDLTTTAATFNLINTTATTLNIGAGATTAVNIGASSADVVVAGDLKVTGNDIKSSTGAVAITLSANDVSMPDKLTVTNEIVLDGTQPFVSFFRATPVDGVETVRGVRGQVTVDDYWFVGGGSTGDDAGYLLLATSDNSATAGFGEPILVRQYGGSGLGPANTPWNASTTITREAKLLDENGYSIFPERVGINTTTPTVGLDVNGSAIIRGTSLTVSGNLIVNGTTTTINSTTLTVDDKNIEIGSVDTPTDVTAAGGGVTLRGATDKTIIWNDATNGWELNQAVKVGGALRAESAEIISLGATTATTVTTFNGTKESTNQDAGSVLFKGGVATKKNLWVGGNLSIDSTTAGTASAGSLQTDGGISVTGSSYFGDFINYADIASRYVSASTTTSTAAFTLASTTKDAMKVFVNISRGSERHACEIMVMWSSATTAQIAVYGELFTTSLATFDADVSSGTLRLKATPASATSTTFSFIRDSLN